MVATHGLNLVAPGSIPGLGFFRTRLSASAVCLAVDHGIRSHTQEAKKIVTILSWPPPLATRRVSVRGYLFDQLYSSLRLVFESSDDKDFFTDRRGGGRLGRPVPSPRRRLREVA